MLIDTHCHLHHRRYHEELPALSAQEYLANAQRAGVGQLISIACRRAEWAGALAFASEHPTQVGVVCGIHPNDAGAEPILSSTDITLWSEAEKGAQNGQGGYGGRKAATGATLAPPEPPLSPLLARHSRLVGVGETGLDYHYNYTEKSIQIKSFHAHLEVAKQLKLPAVIHTREAESDTIQILREYPSQPFVLHCFSGTRWLAEEGLAIGGYLSFSGILTFKNAIEIKEIAKSAPRDKVLLETDAPYLAPNPKRSFRNESKYLTYTAEVLADLWQCSQSEVAKITTTNAKRLFSRL
jgi:TatD DNase family protein